MDEELRRLERAAATGDPESTDLYLHHLIRTGLVTDIEIRARLGDQAATHLYLQILDYQGEIDLDHLWVVPSIDEYISTDYEVWPYDTPLLPPIPYILGTTLSAIERYYREEYEYIPGGIVESFIVDVSDLELAEALGNTLGGAPGPSVEDVKFSVLKRTAILIMDSRGLRFPSVRDQEIAGRRANARSTANYLSSAANHLRFGRSHLVLDPDKIRDENRRWPHRQVKQLLPAILPQRDSEDPYVVIIHIPSMRGFILGGTYGLLSREVSTEDIIFALRYNRQEELGWLPTQKSQMPGWAGDLPKDEFRAYWVAE